MLFSSNFQILSALFFSLVLWLLGLSVFLYKSISHYNQLTGGKSKEGLREILEEILKGLKVSKKEIEDLKKKVLKLEEESFFYIRKVGLVKFNPFKDIGGKQSFVLSLLDGRDCGLVVTSLHGRETTRFYVKKVKQGEGVKYQLSKEEIEAVKKASKL